MVSPRHPVIAVVGPTATGKSSCAEALARQLDGEIVSADSMQVYKGMDIGTAKVPQAERSVAYHCLDLAQPSEEFNANRYQKEARAAIDDILVREKQPIVCGGTGLYVRAALDDFDLGEGEQDDEVSSKREKRRKRLEAEASALGTEAFYAKLVARDAKSAALIHPHNTRRVIRAFEWLEEGGSYAQQAAGFDEHNEYYPTVFLGLDIPREELYLRINARVEQMIQAGLLEETRGLLKQGYESALTAQQAIGYKELVPVLAGKEELEVAVDKIQRASRQYAKRQKSWFRRDERIHWLDARLPQDELVRRALGIIKENSSALPI